jgi:hypothetical protein
LDNTRKKYSPVRFRNFHSPIIREFTNEMGSPQNLPRLNSLAENGKVFFSDEDEAGEEHYDVETEAITVSPETDTTTQLNQPQFRLPANFGSMVIVEVDTDGEDSSHKSDDDEDD